MSLYNQLHGVDPLAGDLLFWLDIDQPDGKYRSGRFRDCHLMADGERIQLLARIGGGNRKEYETVIDELKMHPWYRRDYDDEYDNTYAIFEFSVPPMFKKMAKTLAPTDDPKPIKDLFDQVMEEMNKMTPEEIKKDPRFAPTAQALESILSSPPGSGVRVIQL